MKLFSRILFLILLMSSSLASAQFADIPSPYNSYIMAYENQGDRILVVDRGDSFPATDQHAALRWVNETGTIASSGTKLRTIAGEDSNFSVRAVSQLGNMVYVIYSAHINGIFSYRLARYDTVTQLWARLTNTDNFLSSSTDIRLDQIKAFDNRIFIGGRFFNGGLNGLLVYNPAGDSVYTTLFLDSSINQLQIFDSKLYVSGLFRVVDGASATGGLVSFANNMIWNDAILNDSFTNPYNYFTRLNSNFDAAFLYQNTDLQLFDKDGSNASNIVGNLNLVNQNSVSSLADFDNKIWLTSNTSGNGVFVFNPISKIWTFVNSNMSGQAKLEKIGNSLILIETSSTLNMQRFTRFGPVVKGNVFIDLNNNCIRDAGEPGLVGKTVSEKAGRWAAITDANGQFNLIVDTAGFYIDTLYGLFNLTKANCGSDSLEVDGTQDTVYYNAAYKEISPGNSVKLNLYSNNGFRARQGFTESIGLIIENFGSTPKNCEYTIRIPDDFHLISLNQNINDSTGKDYSFNVSLQAGESKNLLLRVLVPVNTPSLQHRNFYLYADSNCLQIPGDSLRLQVRGAYDPNDKQCSEDALMPKNTKLLKYHIRFQNTGTDTAYRVTIIDTIDRHLPINYIKIRKASHPYRTEVLHERGSQYYALKFTFDNVLLPDSTTDEPGSHGYIQYETSINSNFGKDDTLYNKAYIFFDYQSAIITNNVANSWDTTGNGTSIVPKQKLDDLIIIYPNPSSSEITILNDLSRPLNFKISDSQGKTIGYAYVGPKGKSNFVTETLPAGIYYLQSPDGLIKKRFIVMRAQ